MPLIGVVSLSSSHVAGSQCGSELGEANRLASKIVAHTDKASYHQVIAVTLCSSRRKTQERERDGRSREKKRRGENVKLSGLFSTIPPRSLSEKLIFCHLKIGISHLSFSTHTSLPPHHSLSLKFFCLFFLDFPFFF